MDTNACLPQISLVLFFITFTCKIAEGTPGVNALQQLLSENGRGTGYNSFEGPDTRADEQSMQQLLQELQLAKALQLMRESNAAEQGSKRIFCNEVTGCRNRERTLRPAHQPTLSKRPFCNGFFGCSNGKRSKPIPIVEDSSLPEVSETSGPQKRLFCNMNGCGNGKKRSLYDALIESLKSNKDVTRSEGNELQIFQANNPIQVITIDEPLNDGDRSQKPSNAEDLRLPPYQKRLPKPSQKVLSGENEMCSDNICKKWLYGGRRGKKMVYGDKNEKDDFYRDDKRTTLVPQNNLLLLLKKSHESSNARQKLNQEKCVVFGDTMICQQKELNCDKEPCDMNNDVTGYILPSGEVPRHNNQKDSKGITMTDTKETGIKKRCFSYNTREYDC